MIYPQATTASWSGYYASYPTGNTSVGSTYTYTPAYTVYPSSNYGKIGEDGWWHPLVPYNRDGEKILTDEELSELPELSELLDI